MPETNPFEVQAEKAKRLEDLRSFKYVKIRKVPPKPAPRPNYEAIISAHNKLSGTSPESAWGERGAELCKLFLEYAISRALDPSKLPGSESLTVLEDARRTLSAYGIGYTAEPSMKSDICDVLLCSDGLLRRRPNLNLEISDEGKIAEPIIGKWIRTQRIVDTTTSEGGGYDAPYQHGSRVSLRLYEDAFQEVELEEILKDRALDIARAADV